jgi:hypothetical protein
VTQKAERATRDKRIIEMRRKGLPWKVICTELDVFRGTAIYAIKRDAPELIHKKGQGKPKEKLVAPRRQVTWA